MAIVGFGEQLGIHEDARDAATGVAGFLSLTVFAPFLRHLFRDEDGDGTPDVFQGGKGLVMLLGAFVLAGALSACEPATPQERAQAALSTGAEVLKAFDEVSAKAYTQAAEQALAEAASFAEYSEAMEGWDRLEKALRGTKAGLLVLQAALNVWEATGDGTIFNHVAACFVSQARLLLDAGEQAGLEVGNLRGVVQLAASYAAGVCMRGVA